MAPRPDGPRLEIKRVLPAAPPLVFKLFTDPNELTRWWGPAGFNIPSLEFDAVVGHRYRIEMQPPDGDPFYLTGAFRVVDRPTRLSYTFCWEDPDPDDLENLVDLIFRDLSESTQVLLTQGPFKTEARHRLHQHGWTDSFDKLEALLGDV